jgi:DNA-binding transcriptional MerR regulator
MLKKMLNTTNDLKLYYSIGEVSKMYGITETTLRYWEREIPQLKPKKAGRNIRQYTKEDLELVKLIQHLLKERGMTLEGVRKRLTKNKEAASKNAEVIDRLRAVRKRLVEMRDALDAFTYQQVDELKENIAASAEPTLG